MALNILLALSLFTCSLNQYVSLQNLTNFTMDGLSGVEISSTSDYIFTQNSNAFFVFSRNGSKYNLFQTGTGWSFATKIFSGGNTLAIGESFWKQQNQGQSYTPFQNLTNCQSSVISRDGLVAACWSSSSSAIYMWTRNQLESNFSRFSSFSIYGGTDVILSSNGEQIAIVTNQQIWVFHRLTPGYFILEHFIHKLQFANFTSPKILASDNFQILIVRDNATVTVVNPQSKHTVLNISYNVSIVDFTFDNSTLALVMADSTLKILSYNGQQFSEVQQISTNVTAVVSNNGTLVALSKYVIYIWKNLKIFKVSQEQQ